MKNQAQGLVNLYLLKNTEMDEETFKTKFHDQTIVSSKLQVTLSDGSVHNLDVMEILELEWTTFQSNDTVEEVVEDKDIATKQNIA